MTQPKSSHPFLAGLMAKVKGEVSASELEALRGAGSHIYEKFTAVEAERAKLAEAGTDLWAPGTPDPRPRLVTWWRAFALQQLGESFLDTDYKADPSTAGYVPPVTAQQVEAYFTEVEVLLHDLALAENNPSWAPRGIPARLPAWVEVEPCPRAHLEAMFEAASVMTAHAELAVADLEKLGAAKHAGDYQRLKADLAALKADATYAEELHAGLHGKVSEEFHERFEKLIKQVVESAYRLGQLAALPQGISSQQPPAARLPIRPGPGERGFDMWCLTDPRTRSRWQKDPAAVNAVEALWKFDPNPYATLAVQADIDTAVSQNAVMISTRGNYFCCPWSAVYRVLNPVTIGGKRLRRGTEFTFDVSAEEMGEGKPFKRDVLTGPFQPTSRVDYCNPESGHHDDDDE